MAAGAPGPDDPAPAAPAVGLLDSLVELLRELPGLVSDRVELLSLELRRAGLALAQIVALVVVAAVLVATAWLALWVGVTAMLVLTLGLHWAAALLLVLLLNLGAAALALYRARGLTSRLTLPATRRHLMIQPPRTASPAPRAAPGAADARATD